jgi:hypothetical protein
LIASAGRSIASGYVPAIVKRLTTLVQYRASLVRFALQKCVTWGIAVPYVVSICRIVIRNEGCYFSICLLRLLLGTWHGGDYCLILTKAPP